MEFDFTNVAPWNPLSTAAPEEGPYEAIIADVDPAYNAGKSTKFSLDLITGPSAGVTTDLYIGNEPGEKGGNRRKWLQALEAVAPDAEKFRAHVKANPKLSFDPVATFKGKKIHVLVVAVPGVDPQGRPNLPNKEFLTVPQYQALLARAKSSPAPSPGPSGGTPASPSPTPSGGGESTLGSLFG